MANGKLCKQMRAAAFRGMRPGDRTIEYDEYTPPGFAYMPSPSGAMEFKQVSKGVPLTLVRGCRRQRYKALKRRVLATKRTSITRLSELTV